MLLVYIDELENRSEVARILRIEPIQTAKKTVMLFLRNYEMDGTIERRTGSGRPQN